LAAGEWGEAARLHPFAYLVLPYALVSASSPFWPVTLRSRVRQSLEQRRGGFDLVYRSAVLAFLAYGGLRAVAIAAGLLPFWQS
jgi:hypothetical protein